MRLWHKDLIPVLPRKQLVAQWRECCLIARNIKVNGMPNHILVNKVLNYSEAHFWKYGFLIYNEMEFRGYKCDFDKFKKWFDKSYALETPAKKELFKHWHTDRYLKQCYYNLQEKYDCSGIPEDEWQKVHAFVTKYVQ